MWGEDVIALREALLRIIIATNGGMSETYLLSLPPYEVLAIEYLVAKIVNPKKSENDIRNIPQEENLES